MLDAVDLDRTLRQHPPHLGDQMFEEVFVAKVAQQVVIEMLDEDAQPIGPKAVALLQVTDHEVEIHRHHLGQEVMGVLGGDGGVNEVAIGHGEQAHLAQALHQGGDRVAMSHRADGKGRHQRLRIVPVAAAKEPGRLERRYPRVDEIDPLGVEHQDAGRFKDLEHRGDALDAIGNGESLDGRIELLNG